jgi:hypothetical protein
MPSPTTRLRLMRVDPGSDLNVWGQRLNENVFDLLDEAAGGVEKISLTGSNGTLTLSSANYATDQARNAALIFQGTPSVDVTVTIPSVEKVYTCVNQTGRTITLTAGGVTVALVPGDRSVVWCDGTDCGFGSMSAQTVNGLITNAQLAGANLPGQAGNQGKFLQTDGAVLQWGFALPDQANNAGKFLQTTGAAATWAALPDIAGGADATITTASTLTASSSVVQSVDMAAEAQSVTLPNATTLTKGGRKFVVLGVGPRSFGVRDAAGTLLTVVGAGGAAELHLRDNATAAGSWGVTGRGLEPALTLLDHTVAPASAGSAAGVAVRLTDTLSLHFGHVTTSNNGGLVALAVDSTPGAASVGTWTVVEAASSNTAHIGFRISDTQAVIFWYAPTATTKAAVLTVDPATKAISVGVVWSSAAVHFMANTTYTSAPNLIQLTPTLYLAQYSALVAAAISVSGTTVTVGAASANYLVRSGAPVALYRMSDSQALAIYVDDSGTTGSPYSIRAVVLTVSGTTVTVGTSAGINETVGPLEAATVQLTANKYLAAWQDAGTGVSGTTKAAGITVSGNTVSFSAALTLETGLSPSSSNYVTSSRFFPETIRLTDTTALLTSRFSGISLRTYVLTEVSGSVVASSSLSIMEGMMLGGGADGVAVYTNPGSNSNNSATVQGISVSSGAPVPVDAEPAALGHSFQGYRFRLSSGVIGIAVNHVHNPSTNVISTVNATGRVALYRQRGASITSLGVIQLSPSTSWGGGSLSSPAALTPVELSANKVAFIAGQQNTAVNLQILEFAAS